MKNLFLRLFPRCGRPDESPVWRTVFLTLLLATLILLPLLSLDAGISADEGRYYNQAKKVYAYYASLGQDKSAITQKGVDPQHYNSQSFDLAMVVLEKVFHPDDPYQMRHFFNALSGWFLFFITGLFVARTAGYRAASLTLLLLFLSPRLLGHSYNNNKDIPVSAAFAMSTYFMMAFFRDFPRRKLRNAAWIAVAIASGISLRIGTIVLIPYFFLFAGLYFLATTPFRQILAPASLRKAGTLLGVGFAILPCSYFLGILPWPFGLEGPIKNTAEVLKAMSLLGVSIMQVFEGEMIWSNQIPWYYSIKYMAITIPSVVFAGIALFVGLSPRIANRGNAFPLFILAFSWLFPIIYAALKIKNDYGGWRHLMFTYPYMVALAAIGFDALFRRLPKKSFQAVAGVAFLALCFPPAAHIVRNHPHEYVYFNELFGGVDQANGYYETDYYQHSLRAGTGWLLDHVDAELAQGKPLIIAVNDSSLWHQLRHLKDRVGHIGISGYHNHGRYDWDYGVFYSGYISPHQLRSGLWPPAGTIHTVKVDNTPVCAVVKRLSKEDFLGYEALKTNDAASAIAHFKNYLAIDPQDDGVHSTLASVYLAKGEMEPARHHAGQALLLHPESVAAMDTMGRIQLQSGQYDAAIQTFSALAKKTGNYHLPYYFMAVAYLNKGNPDAAIEMGNQCIMRHPRFAPAYQLVASAYGSKGNTRAAQAYAAEAQKINSAAPR